MDIYIKNIYIYSYTFKFLWIQEARIWWRKSTSKQFYFWERREENWTGGGTKKTKILSIIFFYRMILKQMWSIIKIDHDDFMGVCKVYYMLSFLLKLERKGTQPSLRIMLKAWNSGLGLLMLEAISPLFSFELTLNFLYLSLILHWLAQYTFYFVFILSPK